MDTTTAEVEPTTIPTQQAPAESDTQVEGDGHEIHEIHEIEEHTEPYIVVCGEGDEAIVRLRDEDEQLWHPEAQRMPMMTLGELRTLGEDIRANGLRHKLTRLPSGLGVDGRNRYLACLVVGRPVTDEDWETREIAESDISAFIVSQNERRRQLTAGQKAILALPYLAEERKLAAERQHAGKPAEETGTGKKGQRGSPKSGEGHEGEAVARAAARVGAGREAVREAERIQQEQPDLLKAVWDGALSLWAAVGQLPTTQQEWQQKVTKRVNANWKRQRSKEHRTLVLSTAFEQGYYATTDPEEAALAEQLIREELEQVRKESGEKAAKKLEALVPVEIERGQRAAKYQAVMRHEREAEASETAEADTAPIQSESPETTVGPEPGAVKTEQSVELTRDNNPLGQFRRAHRVAVYAAELAQLSEGMHTDEQGILLFDPEDAATWWDYANGVPETDRVEEHSVMYANLFEATSLLQALFSAVNTLMTPAERLALELEPLETNVEAGEESQVPVVASKPRPQHARKCAICHEPLDEVMPEQMTWGKRTLSGHHTCLSALQEAAAREGIENSTKEPGGRLNKLLTRVQRDVRHAPTRKAS